MSLPARSHAFDVLLLSALALALFFTNPRITFIDDEVAIISGAAAPLGQTLAAFRTGAGPHEHPPLYDIFLHFWLHLTGGAFAAIRLPAIVFYVLGLWLLSRAAEEIAGTPSARALLWLGALWPFGYHFGRLAAWYSFCFLLVAALTLAYQRTLQQASFARLAILFIVAAALLYTNYFGWAILACLALDYLLVARENCGRAARQLLVCGLALALIYLPLWHPLFVELRQGIHFIHSPKATALLGAFNLYSTFVSESVAPWNWALSIPACLCIAIVLILAMKSSPPPARRFLLYALTLMAVMTVFGFITTKRLLPVTAWLLLPVAAMLGSLPRRRERTVFIAALQIVLCIGWYGIFSRKYYSAPRFIEPWPIIAAEATDRVNSGALVIGNNPSFFLYLTYALRPPGRPGGWEMLQTFSGPGILNDDQWTQRSLSVPREVFFVRGAPAIAGPDPAEDWLDAHCHSIAQRFIMPDPASHLKATYLPEIGELPWRIRTIIYACPPGLQSPSTPSPIPYATLHTPFRAARLPFESAIGFSSGYRLLFSDIRRRGFPF